MDDIAKGTADKWLREVVDTRRNISVARSRAMISDKHCELFGVGLRDGRKANMFQKRCYYRLLELSGELAHMNEDVQRRACAVLGGYARLTQEEVHLAKLANAQHDPSTLEELNMATKKKSAKLVQSENGATRRKDTILGLSACAVIRWVGAQGYSNDQCRAMLAHYGVDAAAGTINRMMSNGRTGYMGGAPELGAKESAELRKVLGKPERTVSEKGASGPKATATRKAGPAVAKAKAKAKAKVKPAPKKPAPKKKAPAKKKIAE